MNLEDHVGDVLAKARAGLGVAVDKAAGVSGLSPDAYAAWESSGLGAGRPDFAALAHLLELDARKLGQLAAGWSPQPQDLGRWRELRCFTTGGGGFTVNCYLVWDEATREAAVFDTGLDAAPVVAAVEDAGLDLRHLFVTHGHADHVAGLDLLRRRFPKVRIRSNLKDAPVDQRNRPDDCIPVGSLRVTHRDTPGHADDGVTYLVGNWPDDAPVAAIVGDALFAGSMGKAPGQFALARRRVRDAILALPGETLVCPGHGPLTTVGEERAFNPFF